MKIYCILHQCINDNSALKIKLELEPLKRSKILYINLVFIIRRCGMPRRDDSETAFRQATVMEPSGSRTVTTENFVATLLRFNWD